MTSVLRNAVIAANGETSAIMRFLDYPRALQLGKGKAAGTLFSLCQILS